MCTIAGRSDYLAHSGGHGCKCSANKDADAPRLIWKPLQQQQQQQQQHVFDPTAACTLLGEKRLLLVGDSTIEQAASTLMNALSPAGCQEQVWFAPGDTLVGKRLGVSKKGEKKYISTINLSVAEHSELELTTGAALL